MDKQRAITDDMEWIHVWTGNACRRKVDERKNENRPTIRYVYAKWDSDTSEWHLYTYLDQLRGVDNESGNYMHMCSILGTHVIPARYIPIWSNKNREAEVEAYKAEVYNLKEQNKSRLNANERLRVKNESLVKQLNDLRALYYNQGTSIQTFQKEEKEHNKLVNEMAVLKERLRALAV